MKSLAVHAKRHKGIDQTPMSPEIYSKVIRHVIQELKPARWSIPEDFLEFSHYRRVVSDLDWTSSPGYPYLLQATNNGLFFGVVNGEPDEQRVRVVWDMVREQLRNRRKDPIRLFVKPEPLNHKKLDEGRYRLISSVSLIDQIIDHMLFGEFNDRLIEKCHETPVKTGWTPMTGGWKEVPVSGIQSTDKASWDWTALNWLFEAELEVRKGLCTNLTEEWIELAAWRYWELFYNCLFVTSGGLLLQQMILGIMKSGSVITIATNSIMQLLLHRRVSYELNRRPKAMWAMGDDVIQEEEDAEYFRRLSQLCILKECSTHVEFAGYRFNKSYVEPLYFGKHAFALLYQKEKYIRETADAYALLYHKSKRRPVVREILGDLTDDLISEDLLTDVWDRE